MRALLCLVATLACVVAGCGSGDEPAATPAATATHAAPPCSKDGLKTFASGKLTIGTDKPAYPPYFEDDDPANGKGFESAVAYAVARKLGFNADQVAWTGVPFN